MKMEAGKEGRIGQACGLSGKNSGLELVKLTETTINKLCKTTKSIKMDKKVKKKLEILWKTQYNKNTKTIKLSSESKIK